MPGKIGWIDLHVEEAGPLHDFYQQVVGWTSEEVPLDGYSDFRMHETGGDTVAGICHARGPNAELPAQWLIYISVEDLDQSLERCRLMGGQLLSSIRTHGEARYCVIKDPAGAVVALTQGVFEG